MSDFAKMDIFFVVTTVAVIVVAILLSFALYRILRILRNVEHVSQIVSDEGDLVRDDIAEMRTAIKREGFKLTHLAAFARKRAASFMRPRKKE
jgi:cell division protein FtsL